VITRIAHTPAPVPVTAPAPAPTTDPATGAPIVDAANYLHPDVVRERTEAGRVAEYETGTLPPGTIEAGAPAYFRTYEQVKAQLSEFAEKYPDLVEVIDIGDTSEKVAGTADRDVLLLRITAKGHNDGKKPTAFHIAGEHAREIANPELELRHATNLLEGYGTDPEATALLQSRVIDIVPMMNADGHVVVEKGFDRVAGGNLMHRKNTAAPSGTDLNRNYEFHWGGPGASSNPRSDTYRGPSAASEPEVQAIQNHATAVKPGIFIDWHSYSELNLFPWGDTKTPTPDHAGFEALAKKFSSFNGYTPQQSIKLYPTSGTSKDWMYGTHKIPGFTIETGRTFHQKDAEFERVWGENAPIFDYVAKVADNPFERVKGPEVLDVHVTAPNAPGVAPRQARISATVSDASNGGQQLAGAEIVLDPFAAPGSGTALKAADGTFDSVDEQVNGLVSARSGERELVYVRAKDADGNWGPLTAQWLGGEDTNA
jgi:hypothetical protein